MSETQNTDEFRLHFTDAEVIELLAKFAKIFPTEKTLLKFISNLYKLGKIEQCLECKSENVEIFREGRRIKCLECFAERWLTSGTYFQNAKKVRLHVVDIFLKCHHVFLSSSRFARLVGCAQSTALQILKRSAMVIQTEYRDADPEITTTLFTEVFFRRSGESPAQQHPSAEQTAVNQRLAEESASKQPSNEEKNGEGENSTTDEVMGDTEREVYTHITFDPIQLDDLLEKLPNLDIGTILASLTTLEIAGLVQRLPGDIYLRIKRAGSSGSLFTLITDANLQSFKRIKNFIFSLYHGVSRKHIEKYVALFWFFFKREQWKGGELLKLCASFAHIPGREITQSVTPPLMKIPLACLAVPDIFS